MRVNSRFIGCTSGGVYVPCVLMFEYGLLDCTVLILLLFFSRCDCLLQTQPMAELADVVHPSSGCNVSNAKCNPSTSKCECEDGFVTEAGDFSCSKYDYVLGSLFGFLRGI